MPAKISGVLEGSIAEELDIDVDEINDIIDRVQRNQHKSKVPESPKKTLMVI